MSRVSKIHLDKDLESELYSQFWYSLGKINEKAKASDFFSDLLSDSEKLMLAKRFAVAVLLSRGRNTTEIHDAIHVSYTTISSVASWSKNAKSHTAKLFVQISKEKNWDAFFDKIDELLDKIHPMPGTNWTEEYEAKRKRAAKRYAAKLLR